MRCVRIGYSFDRWLMSRAANAVKGYELSEEEVRISLDDFREKFGDSNGGPE